MARKGRKHTRALVTKQTKAFVRPNGHDPSTSTVQGKTARVTSRAVKLSHRAIDWNRADTEYVARMQAAHAADRAHADATRRLGEVMARLGLK